MALVFKGLWWLPRPIAGLYLHLAYYLAELALHAALATSARASTEFHCFSASFCSRCRQPAGVRLLVRP